MSDGEQHIKDKHLMELVPANTELEQFISDYHKREKIATHFIPTSEFIKQEIADFNESARNPLSIEVHISATQSVRLFTHSTYATKAFESLTKGNGHNPTVRQLVEQAKAECEGFNKSILRQYGRQVVGVPTDDESFENLIITWIKIGVTFVYYIKFLYEKMEDHLLTFEKYKTLIVVNSGDGNVINTGSKANITVTRKAKSGKSEK